MFFPRLIIKRNSKREIQCKPCSRPAHRRNHPLYILCQPSRLTNTRRMSLCRCPISRLKYRCLNKTLGYMFSNRVGRKHSRSRQGKSIHFSKHNSASTSNSQDIVLRATPVTSRMERQSSAKRKRQVTTCKVKNKFAFFEDYNNLLTSTLISDPNERKTTNRLTFP